MAAPPLQIESLSRSYGRLVALADLSLTVHPGQCVALIGANGSGKSTAVRTIAGQIAPTSGTVRITGFDPHREPEAEQARAAVAIVPDSPLLYADLTVRQHAELVTIAHGVHRESTAARIDALLERLGLAERADFLPAELSRGMRQKAQLVCALVRPASLLVLDEPVVGLDPPSQALLREMLLEAKRSRVAVVLTTHQMAFADGLADRAVMLAEGEVVDDGPWDDVAARAEQRGWRPS